MLLEYLWSRNRNFKVADYVGAISFVRIGVASCLTEEVAMAGILWALELFCFLFKCACHQPLCV